MASQSGDLRDAPVRRDARVRDGCGYRDSLTLQLDSTDLDLTDCVWALTISDYAGGTALLSAADIADVTDGSGIIVDDVDAGDITIWVAPEDVEDLGAGRYAYQVRVEFDAGHALLPGHVMDVVAGEFTVLEDATG